MTLWVPLDHCHQGTFIMSAYGLSLLEIRHLIERALLPDRCECTVIDDVLTVRVTSSTLPTHVVVTNPVRLESLHTSRAIAELVGEARYLLAMQSSNRPDFAPATTLRKSAAR
jgi:hypothetical protein